MDIRRFSLAILAGCMLAALGGCALLDLAPIAEFDIEQAVVYAGDAITFDASPSYGPSSIVAYDWDLGNEASASGKRITTSYSQAGSYTVLLTIETATGQTDTVSRGITVYLRSGTEIFSEDFSTGEASLGGWVLDSTWASEQESSITYISGEPGHALYIRSGADRWHRLTTSISLPPLRVGQKIVFSCRAMTLQTQDGHTFLVVPARRTVESVAGSLPYYAFTSDGGGSYVREPTAYGSEVVHPIAFKPSVYKWHTYRFTYAEDTYEMHVDGVLWMAGSHQEDLSQGHEWMILVGEESSSEACIAYYDDFRVTIEE